MIAEVPRATMVIANPTHFAVALRYVREEGGAPVVIAKGQDLIALKIREVAEAHGIPVFEDPPLARSMFAQVSVDNFIPPVFYKAVAELVHRIYGQTKVHKPQARDHETSIPLLIRTGTNHRRRDLHGCQRAAPDRRG
jgi:flagellar biosynthetic protein FlhB